MHCGQPLLYMDSFRLNAGHNDQNNGKKDKSKIRAVTYRTSAYGRSPHGSL